MCVRWRFPVSKARNMGVRGLCSFFETNSHLRERYQLHNTKVIIDGNNFVYWMYRSSRIDFIYGGDYDKFSKAAVDYFKIFEACRIEPMIVFDGGSNSSIWEFIKTQKRSHERLRTCQEVAICGNSCQLILPILTWNVFKGVLNELGIKYAQCDYGADDQITALANYYKCPVISQDSDFYIFNIEHGFICTDSIDTVIHTEQNTDGEFQYLKCKIYYVDKFLTYFPGIDKDVLPLFGTLIGNDVAAGNHFENFFNNIHLPYPKTKKLKVSKRHNKMIGLLAWLQNHTLEDAIQHVIITLPKSKKDTGKNLIEESMKEYNKNNVILVKYLNDSSIDKICNDVQLFSFKGKPLPSWFIENFHIAYFEPIFLNILGLHRTFLPTQVDDPISSSSYRSALLLRKILYSIFLQFDSESNDIKYNAEQHDCVNCVKEYDRHNTCIKKTYIQPLNEITGYGKIPSLDDIPKMSTDEKINFFKCVINVKLDCLVYFPENWHFLIVTILYWIQNSSPVISASFLNALLMCLIFFSIVKPLLCISDSNENSNDKKSKSASSSVLQDKETKNMSIRDLIVIATTEEANKAYTNLQKFFGKPQHNHAKPIYINIVHMYSQLQACSWFILLFNKIFHVYDSSCNMFQFLNGTFLYNLTRELTSRKCTDLYIAEVVGRNSTLEFLFVKMKKALLQDIPAECISDIKYNIKKNKRIRKASKKNSQNNISNNANTTNSESNETSLSDSNAIDELLDNRFKSLVLTD